MTGIPTALATLENTTFSLTGVPYRIGPQGFENTIATLDARTGGLRSGGTLVRVTDPEFNGGADPYGVTDSTTAFQLAMAAGPAIIPSFAPNGALAIYKVSNCVVPNNATLIGFSQSTYAGSGGSWTNARPKVIPVSPASTLIFNIDSKQGVLMQGFVIDCITAASTCDGISGGGQDLTLRDMSINFCNRGLGAPQGGSVATFPTGTWVCKMFNTIFYGCIAGSLDIIDGFVYGGAFTGCSNGFMPIVSNSGPVTFMGTRFEYCGIIALTYLGTVGYGVNSVGTEMSCCGCSFDGNGNAAVYLHGAVGSTFSSCIFTRNGCNVSSGTTLISTSCHVQFDSAIGATFTGCVAHDLVPDIANGVYAPAAFANFVGAATTSKGIIFVGNDLSNYQGSLAGATNLGPQNNPWQAAGAVGGWATGLIPTSTGTNGLIVTKCFGTGSAAQDIDTRTATILNASFSSINVTTGTLAAGNITGATNVVLLSTNATPGAQLMRSVANMYADLGNVVAGWSYNLRICNSGAGTFTLTVDAGATWALTGTMTVATATFRDFVVTFTSATAGTVRSVGSGTYT